jgi:hypothetical protein
MSVPAALHDLFGHQGLYICRCLDDLCMSLSMCEVLTGSQWERPPVCCLLSTFQCTNVHASLNPTMHDAAPCGQAGEPRSCMEPQWPLSHAAPVPAWLLFAKHCAASVWLRELRTSPSAYHLALCGPSAASAVNPEPLLPAFTDHIAPTISHDSSPY